SESLDWHDCYPGQATKFECARLLVPLNYSAPVSPSNNASIAIIRIPSPYSATSQEYKGPILFNPGGPGGSGVDFVLVGGDLIHAVVGDAFDIVGFDPRGVSRSIPTISFFTNNNDREIWSARAAVFNVVNASTNSLGELVAYSRVVGQLAAATNYNGYLNFINTDSTARDMLQITKAYGMDKIQYWGFSYGSVLGAVFASLFPDNVGRLVVDGVVDAPNYFAALFNENLLDTDKVLQIFFDSCFIAGPSGCSFYASSPEAISKNLDRLYDMTKTTPFPVLNNASSYGVVDYNFLRTTIFISLYSPYSSFPPLADALAELSKGNAKPLWDYGSTTQLLVNEVLDPLIAIGCNDASLIPGTLEDAEQYYNKLVKTSEWADIWIRERISCSAKRMSQGYPGSVVLTQNSAGHTSISAPSPCTMNYVRAYFENGTLPEGGTICPVLGPPIPQFNGTQTLYSRQDILSSHKDRAVTDAIVELSKRHRILGPL
ncbi:Alpha/Beta hydrolase protein, partial [Amanita rubescens]